MRDRTPADDIVQGAYNRALLDLIIGPMRTVAKEAGYAITIHGSLNRDIDLVAIAWRENNVWTPEALYENLVGAIRGVTGKVSYYKDKEWTKKPHGRITKTITVWCGQSTADLDISVIPSSEEDK